MHVGLALLLLSLTASVSIQTWEERIEGFPGAFVFVSGWPQSGTSLLNEMLTLTPGINTMVKACEKRHGSRCKNWNDEGQWLLDRSTLNRKYMRPGAMCPSQNFTSTLTDIEQFGKFRDGCIETWSSYWDFDRAFIVSEKSPQSILKIPLYMKIFQKAQRVKFLVIVKHPASLNIAVMRGKGWYHSYEAVKRTKGLSNNSNNKYQEVEKVMNTVPMMINNLRYFVQFMLKGFDQPVNRDKENCELGWLAGMQSFQNDVAHIYEQRVLSDDNSTVHHVDVKVMRFESFETPFETCKDIFAYIFDRPVSSSSQNSDYNDDRDGNRYRTSRLSVKKVKEKFYRKAVESVCSLYFIINGDQTESEVQTRDRTMKAIEQMITKRSSFLRKRIGQGAFSNIGGANRNHRILRLQNQMPEDTFFRKKLNFHISSVNKVVERVREMKAVMQHAEVKRQLRTNASLASIMSDLRRIDTALRPYGYSIAPVLDDGPKVKRYFLKTSVLDKYMLPGLLQRLYRIV